MSLSKQQIVGLGCGGAFLLAAGALGYMLFDAATERSEEEEGLELATSRFSRYNAEAVFPSQKSIDAVKSNETSYAAWRESAVALAARGDRPPPVEEEPSVFKQRLQNEVQRMVELPGGVGGHIAAAGFLFGFEQFLGESGVLPQAADVPRLAVQLDAIAHVIDMFAEVGVLEVKTVRRVDPQPAEDEGKSSKGKKKPAKAKKEAEDAPKTTCLEYAFEFLARPAAVVQVLNKLSSDVRFMVVKDFLFQESADMILDRISGKEAAEAQANAPTTGRRRRRAMLEQPAEQKEEPKVDSLVVDPELDAPIRVQFTLAVYDFGHGQAKAETATAASEGEAASVSAKEKPVPAKDKAANGKEAK